MCQCDCHEAPPVWALGQASRWISLLGLWRGQSEEAGPFGDGAVSHGVVFEAVFFGLYAEVEHRFL